MKSIVLYQGAKFEVKARKREVDEHESAEVVVWGELFSFEIILGKAAW